MKLKSRMNRNIDFWERTERIRLRRIAHGAVISVGIDAQSISIWLGCVEGKEWEDGNRKRYMWIESLRRKWSKKQ